MPRSSLSRHVSMCDSVCKSFQTSVHEGQRQQEGRRRWERHHHAGRHASLMFAFCMDITCDRQKSGSCPSRCIPALGYDAKRPRIRLCMRVCNNCHSKGCLFMFCGVLDLPNTVRAAVRNVSPSHDRFHGRPTSSAQTVLICLESTPTILQHVIDGAEDQRDVASALHVCQCQAPSHKCHHGAGHCSCYSLSGGRNGFVD